MELIKSALARMERHFSTIVSSEKALEKEQASELRHSFTEVENNFERLWQVRRELRIFTNAKRQDNSKPISETEKKELKNFIDAHEILLGKAQKHAYRKFNAMSIVHHNTWTNVLDTLTNYSHYLQEKREKLGI